MRITRIAIALAVAVTACSSGGGTATSTGPPTTTAPPTTTSVPTTSATTEPEDHGGSFIAERGFEGPVTARGIGDDYFPTLGNPGYDVGHYTLDLVFDPAETRLDGVATITAAATEPLDTINLDFSGMKVSSVTVDGVAALFEVADEDLVIASPMPIPQGEDFAIDVEYGGFPTKAQSGGVPFGIGWMTVSSATRGTQNYVVAEPDAAHSWFPCNDHPLDKATYTIRLTVPEDVTAAANGILADKITDLGQTTWIWEMNSPMASYLATVVIGDFDIVEDTAARSDAGIPIRHVLPAGTTVADWPGLERQGEMVAFLEEKFGPYPFAAYGIAIVDGFGAALENQTLSLFDSNLAQSALFEDVLIHELAHQWFGNSVSPGRWQDVWLNEGFASYAEWLWIEREAGLDTVNRDIERERDQFDGSGLPPPGQPPVFNLFNGSVYRVGAMTLHALRITVGDDAFFDILRTYVATFSSDSAVTDDFVAVAESVSGMELSEFFDSWLYSREVPQFP